MNSPRNRNSARLVTLHLPSARQLSTQLLLDAPEAYGDRLSERVLITRRVLRYAGSGVGVLPRGKQVTLGALLDGLLLVSGNDAAIALSQHDARTVAGFVRRMNLRAQQLGLTCSHFSTPSGIKDEGNHSCAVDLATLARLDLANPVVRRIVGTRRIRMRFPVKGGYLDLFNINPFIDDPGVTGVKTGLTNAAGRCYVITARLRGDNPAARSAICRTPASRSAASSASSASSRAAASSSKK